MIRECQGYVIIKAEKINDNEEVVIGRNERAANPYVCWYYRHDRDEYYWGRYSNTYNDAISAMYERYVNSDIEHIGEKAMPLHKDDGEFDHDYEQDYGPSL